MARILEDPRPLRQVPTASRLEDPLRHNSKDDKASQYVGNLMRNDEIEACP